MRRTILIVALAVALVSAPVVATTGGSADPARADVGNAPPAQTTDQCTFPVTRTDATGRQVTIAEDPDEVFTLGPSAAQTMWEIGAQDEVVGVSYSDISYVDYLPGIEEKTNAGNPGFTPISTSVVINEDPDLVLAANIIPKKKIQQLRDAGLTVYQFREATSVDFVIQKTRDYGTFVGHCEQADERADRMETEVDLIRSAVANTDRPKALYLFGSSGYTAGEGTFINELVQTAGVDNIADERIDGYGQLNTEIVLLEDPHWLIRTREFDTSAYAGTTFHDEDQIITVDDNFMNQPGPRIVDVMRDIVEQVHPEAYAQADLDEQDGDSPGKWTAVDDDGLAVLTAENAPSATSFFEFPEAFEANDSDVHLETLEVTATEPGRTYLTTVGHTTVNTGDRVTGDRVAAYSLEAGGLLEEDFVNATVEFSVPRETLAARNASTDDVQVWSSTRIAWAEVDTTVVNESGERIRFRATLPRESPFVVTMPPVVEDDRTTSVDETTPETPTTETADAEATRTPTPTPTDAIETTDATPTTAQATTAGTPTTGSGPGLGLFGSIVALLAAAILFARRR